MVPTPWPSCCTSVPCSKGRLYRSSLFSAGYACAWVFIGARRMGSVIGHIGIWMMPIKSAACASRFFAARSVGRKSPMPTASPISMNHSCWKPWPKSAVTAGTKHAKASVHARVTNRCGLYAAATAMTNRSVSTSGSSRPFPACPDWGRKRRHGWCSSLVKPCWPSCWKTTFRRFPI